MNSYSTEPRDVRKFGLIAVLFFGALAAAAVWRDKDVMAMIFSLPTLLGAVILLLPGPMTPVYRGWVQVGQWIGQGVTVVLLTLAYYLVMTPYGLVMRLFGKCPLPLDPEPDRDSYWVTRKEPAQPKERFYKRY